MRQTQFDYGRAPAADEFEVIVFGPGYGEAIAVHLGADRWILVDSCLAPHTSAPASADYLKCIGVATDCVQAIVASHWHDDHVRGMSDLVAAFPRAQFYYPAVFADREAQVFLATYGGASCAGLVRGTKELYRSLVSRERSIAVKSRLEILEDKKIDPAVRVVAFSPTDAAFSQFLARIFEYIPRKDQHSPIAHAPAISPNLSSIVLHVDLGSEALLLGADLERHEAGWNAVVTDSWCRGKPRAGLIKLPHHGSVSGDHPEIWGNLTVNRPLAFLSPFNNGRHALPTPTDVARILTCTSKAFITSHASRRAQIPADQLKRLQDMCSNIAPVNAGFGAVRARRRVDAADWQVEMFGSAAELRLPASRAA